MVVPIGLALVHQARALVLFGFAVADWGRARMEQEA
jgi:heme A synthase